MGYENIIYSIDGNIATVTFNRPKALNALNGALLNELDEALDDVLGNEDIRVLVLTGSGDKSFVAGADISELATFDALQAKNFAQHGHGRLRLQWQFKDRFIRQLAFYVAQLSHSVA